MARLENHAHHLDYVSTQDNTNKEVHKEAKGLLRMDRPCQHNQAIVGAEIRRQVLFWPPEALRNYLLLCYHRHLVVHNGVHNNVENCGQEWVALCHSLYRNPLMGGNGTLQTFPPWWSAPSTSREAGFTGGPQRSLPGFTGTGTCPGNFTPFLHMLININIYQHTVHATIGNIFSLLRGL